MNIKTLVLSLSLCVAEPVQSMLITVSTSSKVPTKYLWFQGSTESSAPLCTVNPYSYRLKLKNNAVSTIMSNVYTEPPVFLVVTVMLDPVQSIK